MKKIFIFYGSALLILASCNKENPVDPVVSPAKDTTILNVSYGNDASQKMDLYLPAGRTDTTRLIILIHGGGWSSGDKAELSVLAQGWKARRFAVANINYRLSPQSDDNYKMQLDDIASAIAKLQTDAAGFIYSKSKLYITGHSAGAQLALAYAYTRNSSGLIKAIGGMASPTNLFSMAYYNPNLYAQLLTPYLGVPLNGSTTDRYTSASPYYQATSQSVPTILFQGDIDIIVQKEQSQSLAHHLTELNVPNKLIIYPFTFHDWWTNGDFLMNTLDETAVWFRKY